MPTVNVRKIVTQIEEIFHEGGPPADVPLRRGAIMAVIENPFAGGYVPEVADFMETLKPLGLDMAKQLLDALGGDPAAMGYVPGGMGGAVSGDNAQMPGYAWPSYAAHPNYAALTYPKQYSAAAWPYIGPFYPYPQVPLGWRKVALEWDDGWWFLDFSDTGANH